MFCIRKNYLLLCLTLFLYTLSQAQNCNQINTWLKKAESYSQGLNLNELGDIAIMKLVSPAFHNDYFKPVFKKAYADLSADEKVHIKQQLLTCANDKPYVIKGIVPGFEIGNKAYSWQRQIKAINNSSSVENDRIWEYQKRQRIRINEKNAVAQQRYPSQTRTRSRTPKSRLPVRPQNPNAYNASPAVRKNTVADYQKEATEMRTVLKAIQYTKAPAMHFNGYNNAVLLQKVYDGNFEGFPIGLNDMQEKNLMGGFQKIAEVKKYERYLKQYLEYFSKHCASKNKGAYVRVPIQYIEIEERNGVSSENGETKLEIYYMKPYFVKDFKRIDKNNMNVSLADAIYAVAKLDAMGFDFPPDLTKLFASQQCESPAMKQFETNLYLASKGKSSLQKLLPFVK